MVRASNKRPRTLDQTSPSHTKPSKQEREIFSSAQEHVVRRYVHFSYSACFLRLFLLLRTRLHFGGEKVFVKLRESFRKTFEDWEIILKKVTMGYGTGSHWDILIKAPLILVSLFSGLLDWIIPIRNLVLKFPCWSCLWLFKLMTSLAVLKYVDSYGVAMADPGEGPGGPGPPYFRPNWGPKDRKFSFETEPPLSRQDKTTQCFIWSLIQSYVHLYPNNL